MPFVGIPALMGVAFAFGVAELLFGYLNASTAFMGSIVVGNGINFPIIQLARYEEERRRGNEPARGGDRSRSRRPSGPPPSPRSAPPSPTRRSWSRASAASRSSAPSAALGMVAAWLATVVVLPALWARVRPARARRAPLRAAGDGAFSELVARIATQAPRSCLMVFGC